MNIRFETCERNRALGFLQKLYPHRTIMDTCDCAAPLLDLVEKDIVRIPDPKMHGCRVEMYPSKNWDILNKEQYMTIITEFHNKYK